MFVFLARCANLPPSTTHKHRMRFVQTAPPLCAAAAADMVQTWRLCRRWRWSWLAARYSDKSNFQIKDLKSFDVGNRGQFRCTEILIRLFTWRAELWMPRGSEIDVKICLYFHSEWSSAGYKSGLFSPDTAPLHVCCTHLHDLWVDHTVFNHFY